MLIEFAGYATHKTTSEAAHLKVADAAHRAVIAPLEGFNGRVLCARDPQGAWTDMVLWEDQHRFEQASRQVMENPACQNWTASMQQDSVVMQTAILLPGYGPRDLHLEEAGCWLVVSWCTLAGIDHAEHQALNREIQAALMPDQEGFLGVVTARDPESGRYFEVLAFRDKALAKKGLEELTAACGQHPRFQQHLQDCDPEQVTTELMVPQQRWVPAAARV
ncbi:hypothetical protein [Acanthopleuribacter pedis]|uniref:ABM domain-containing protein n=1 Tax=Acanthopleuribacter pedis TaxID=442870 RepID=A0A8J7U4W3_9BACT|nr:hypothetical protein [Acanthopleuribacter pedis]MBO1318726.1 hypothetical protein [Acanthopleuribacter pedis]